MGVESKRAALKLVHSAFFAVHESSHRALFERTSVPIASRFAATRSQTAVMSPVSASVLL
jgi:hypothetical protein